MSDVLMNLRKADGHRLRELWLRSVTEQPQLAESRRIEVVVKEFVSKTPSGNFVYIASMRKNPSLRWMTEALRGRLGNNARVLGDSLLAEKPRNMRGMGQIRQERLEALEKRVAHIEDQLGLGQPGGV